MNCIFDNPFTCQRQLWVDKKLVCWISLKLIQTRDFALVNRLGLAREWIRPFVDGAYDGDLAAIDPSAIVNPSVIRPFATKC
jgi:hypothetical protein